jgi:MoxR-like ATPase
MNQVQPTPENEKEKQSAKFSIDIIPIEDKEDKLSYFTNMSILSKELAIDKAISIAKQLWIAINNNSTWFGSLYNEKYLFLKNEWAKNGYSTSERYLVDKFFKSGCLLFQTKKIFIQNKILVIETTDNMSFMAKDIEEYLKSWILALKKTDVWGIKSYLAQQKQVEKIVLDAWILKIKSKQLLSIGADDYCPTDDSKNELCILKDNKIATYTYDDDSINRQSDYFDLSIYGDIKNIKTDSNNNFYFIICEKEGRSELKVLNRKTLEDIMSFTDLTEIVYLSDEQGKLFCMDKDEYLRIITINTKNLDRWYVDNNTITAESTASTVVKIEDKPRSELKNLLKDGGITISHETEEALDSNDNHDDSSLREQLWNTTIEGRENITLRNLYDSAENSKDIDIVYHIAWQLKKNPHVMAVKWLVDPIIEAITKKRDTIRLADMGIQLREISTNIENIKDFSWLIWAKATLQSLRQQRWQIIHVDKEVDALLKETLDIIESKIKEYQEEHKENIIKDIEKSHTLIKEYMDWIDFLPQITSIYSTDLRKNTEDTLQYLDAEGRKAWKKKLNDLVQARQHILSRNIKEWEKSKLQSQEETINEIKSHINNLKSIIESINDEDALKSMEVSDPLVVSLREQIGSLPVNKSTELEQRLDKVFKERLLSIQFTKESAGKSIKSLDQYGIPKSLYFVPDIIKKTDREVIGKPTKDGMFKVQFISSNGNIIEPNINKKILGNFKFTYTFEERQELKKTINEWNSNGIQKEYSDIKKDPKTNEKKIKEIEQKYYIARMLDVMKKISNNGIRESNPRPNLPSIDNKTVITPSIQKTLGKRSRILAQQEQYKQGIMIVESEAWTGKNFKCDILWHLTNREIFDVSCNEYMEKEDLLFSPEIDNEGTHRKESKLVQWLQTPWAIIVLDEINTLRPWVSKLLNPLLDWRRYINDPQMGRIKAHPSVLIVWLMNPRYYLGTKQLPQEIVSRARITNDEYAPAQEEAFMISRYIEWSLGNLSEDEFNHYRDEYIVRRQKPTDKSVYNLFVALENVVKIAKNIRETYSRTMQGKAEIGEELHYIFTTRDGNFTIQDFNHSQDIQTSLEDIIIPKITDFEEKEYTRKLIESICKK